ncbi:MAG: hypothetical protein K8R67_04075 [Desulfobacteraceae bacterium]|nr:hypothetical protein [Desulfobacteraceae bacterium]
MKSKINNRNNMTNIGLAVSIFILMVSCDTSSKRTKLVDELSKHFQENYIDFETTKKYLSEEKSYFGFAFDYKDNKVKLKQGENSIKLDSISQIKGDTTVYNILIFMKEEGIRDISGNKEWIKVTYEEQKYPCFSFWFRADFNPEDKKTAQKIINFHDNKSKNWIFILKDKWFIKGETCF